MDWLNEWSGVVFCRSQCRLSVHFCSVRLLGSSLQQKEDSCFVLVLFVAVLLNRTTTQVAYVVVRFGESKDFVLLSARSMCVVVSVVCCVNILFQEQDKRTSEQLD